MDSGRGILVELKEEWGCFYCGKIPVVDSTTVELGRVVWICQECKKDLDWRSV